MPFFIPSQGESQPNQGTATAAQATPEMVKDLISKSYYTTTPPTAQRLDAFSKKMGDGLQPLFFSPNQTMVTFSFEREDADRVEGLENGADDYLTKPFNLVEFLLRVKGMLRRSSWYRPEPVEEGYRFGDNEVFLLSYRAKTAHVA